MNPPQEPNNRPLGGTIALLLFLVLVFTTSCHDIWNGDLGFHLAGGRLIADTGRVPRVDDFSHTMLGTPWNDFEWLYQWVTYQCWAWGGPELVILQHAALNVLTFALLGWALFRARGFTMVGFAILITALIVCELRFSVRPHAVARLFFAAFLLWLLAYRARPGVPLWPLVPLQALWSNLHGSYILGLILVVLLLVDELLERKPVRRLLGLMGGLLVASCATPYGWGQTTALFLHRGAVTAHATNPEWRPIDLSLPVLLDPALVAFAVLVVLLAWWLWLGPGRATGWFERGIWLLALFAPFVHVRAVHLSAVALCALAGATAFAAPYGPGVGRRRPGGWRYVLLSALLVGAVSAVITNWYWDCTQRFSQRGFGVSELAPGYEAGRFLSEFDDIGPVFNTYATGGWLIWWLYPKGGRVYIDGRDIGNIYTAELFEEYAEVMSNPARFDEAAERYRWRAVVLERENKLCRPLIAHLESSGDWALVHVDANAAVFIPRILQKRLARET